MFGTQWLRWTEKMKTMMNLELGIYGSNSFAIQHTYGLMKRLLSIFARIKYDKYNVSFIWDLHQELHDEHSLAALANEHKPRSKWPSLIWMGKAPIGW